MSLNGLDTPHVQDAYQSAVAEAGGWFLLKYTSRDSVDLLGRGKNGVSEARNAILRYSEPSPLYGLIIYRRRRILIKCVPDGTSRLLQARTAVHLQDVLERYSPYETVLEITHGDGLNDTALAASFQLRTASASPSPAPSTPRLDEISEDAEDSGAEDRSRTQSTSSSMSAPPRHAHALDRRAEYMKKYGKRASSLAVSKAPLLHGHRSRSPASPLKQSVSQYLVHDEAGHTSITSLESPPPLFDTLPAEAESTGAGRGDSVQDLKDLQLQTLSVSASQSTAADASGAIEVPMSPTSNRRPRSAAPELRDRQLPALPTEDSASATHQSASMGEQAVPSSLLSLADEAYDFSKFDELFKPKVKLAPRPVNPPEKIQSPALARVSALPTNFRPANRKQEPPRPKSSGNGLAAPARLPPPAPIPYLPSPPPPVPETPDFTARPTSRGSVRSAPSHKSRGMTPDKIRLMKAVELRRKQLRKSQEPSSRPMFAGDGPEIPNLPDMSDRIPSRMMKIARTPEPVLEPEQPTDDNEQLLSSKADSGIEMHYRKQDKISGDHDLQSTPGASKPNSPELGTISTSHSTGHTGAPPVIHETPKEIDPAMEDSPWQLQPDDASSIASKTPTELSEFFVQESTPPEVALVPTIITADNLDVQAFHAATEADGESSNVEDLTTEIFEQPPSSPRRQSRSLANRRRGHVEPLQTDLNSGSPDDFASDDDELIEELHSAIIVEARPITVARTPRTPTFPGRRPSADTLASVRSVNITRMGSFPTDKGSDDRLTPDSFRNVTSKTMTPPADKTDPTSGLSRIVSSEISKRIQALSLQSHPLTPEVSPRPTRSRPTSYRRHSSNRVAQSPARNALADSAPVWTVQHDPATNRNSVSVTARIVRPNLITQGVAEDSSEILQQSEYVVNHERDPSNPRSRPESVYAAKGQSEASMPALSPVLSRSSTEARTMHSAGNSRFGRHKYPNSFTQVSTLGLDDFPAPPGARTRGSTPSLKSNDENVAPKEGSKAGRFMKRMSILPFGGANKRKSGTQQHHSARSSVGNETTGTAAASTSAASISSRVSSVFEKSDMPPAVVVGDLNVQFPDSLLWKRRLVTIDDFGYLQFAIAQGMEIHKGVALKKFPLNDFKLPYMPDLDAQELAYSIMLEFHDGTTLQIACEDAMTQRQVLHILKTYWKSWA